MSRLWRDDLTIGLCPDRLVIVRRARGFRRQVLSKRTLCFDPSPLPQPWNAACREFGDFLSSPDGNGARITVVLSSHFVRYAVLPWNDALSGHAEWAAYARHAFGNTYGAVAADWEIRISPMGRRSPQVACATERALVEALFQAAHAAGMRLHSIQPALMAAYNRVGRLVRGHTTWIAVQEARRVTIALLSGRAWQFIRTRNIGGDWNAELPRLLHRESLLAGSSQQAAELLVYAEEVLHPGTSMSTASRTLDVTLERGLTSDLRPYALALC